jgi:hypothetical protein
MRINPRTGDPVELAALAAITMADLAPASVPAVLAYATQPDESMRVVLAAAQVDAATWGQVPRTYIRTARDRALPAALQDRMIAEADRLTSANLFDVHTLDTSHFAPITCAHEITDILVSCLSTHVRSLTVDNP